MLHKIKKSVLAAMLLLLPLSEVQAMEPVMSAEELTPGMRGYAKTVILGRDIQTFDIEILGVIKDGRQSQGRILAKASGDVIEQSGGVLQGMSGSPVYIDGYLIGAVSGGWKNIDNRICIITPIGEMMKLWELPDEKSAPPKSAIDLKAAFAAKHKDDSSEASAREKSIVDDILNGATATDQAAEDEAAAEADSEAEVDSEANADSAGEVDSEAAADSEADAADTDANAEANKADEADESQAGDTDATDDVIPSDADTMATPLMVGGLSGRGLDFLSQQLAKYDMVPFDAGVGSSGNAVGSGSIEPGSSVGVQLVRGDISIAAIGTVTAVDGDKVLAFGHSFLHRGNVGYFMTEADIISTASGVNNGFKIGVPGQAVGTINQDRESGVAGRLGYFPQVVPMQVEVDDKGTATDKRYDVQLTYHEELIPALAATIAYNAMEKSMDTATEGTVKISFELATNDGGGDKIVRENMYYAPQNVSQLSINELADFLSALCSNTSKEADIYNIKVKAEISNKRNTASIIEIKPEKTKVKPGETIQLTLKLKPYRRATEEIKVPFMIPEGSEPGAALLEARGGGLVAVSQLAMSGLDMSPEEDKTKPLEATIREMTDRNKNNEILVDLLPMQETQKASQKKTGDKVAAAPKPTKTSSSYIIDNVHRIGITIEKKK